MYKKTKFTLSIGGCLVRETEHDLKEVLTRVDEAVYAAKNRGKNEVMLYENIVRGDVMA